MMNKETKKNYIEEMKKIFSSNEAVMIAHYQGLNVIQLDSLRKELRENNILFKKPELIDQLSKGIVNFYKTQNYDDLLKIFFLGISTEIKYLKNFIPFLEKKIKDLGESLIKSGIKEKYIRSQQLFLVVYSW